MFVGRKSELSQLNKMYKGNSFEMAIIYGRRRVGKTSLINEFRKGKKTIFFVAIDKMIKEPLRIFLNKYLQFIHLRKIILMFLVLGKKLLSTLEFKHNKKESYLLLMNIRIWQVEMHLFRRFYRKL